MVPGADPAHGVNNGPMGEIRLVEVVERPLDAVAVERLLGSRPAIILCFLDYAGGVHLHRAMPV
jgi:hypothetical protein